MGQAGSVAQSGKACVSGHRPLNWAAPKVFCWYTSKYPVITGHAIASSSQPPRRPLELRSFSKGESHAHLQYPVSLHPLDFKKKKVFLVAAFSPFRLVLGEKLLRGDQEHIRPTFPAIALYEVSSLQALHTLCSS